MDSSHVSYNIRRLIDLIGIGRKVVINVSKQERQVVSMKVLIAVLMTVFLGLGANSVFANCGTCDKKAEVKAEAKAGCKEECKGCPGGKGKMPDEVIKKFDKDGDGKLSEAEMAECKAAHQAKRAEMDKKMLEKFDVDKDGKLSDAEKAEAHKAMGERKGKHKGEGKCKGEGEKKAEDKSV
jgi:hypothetical protein